MFSFSHDLPVDHDRRFRRRDPLAIARSYLEKANDVADRTTPIKTQPQSALSSAGYHATSRGLPNLLRANYARPTLYERMSHPQPADGGQGMEKSTTTPDNNGAKERSQTDSVVSATRGSLGYNRRTDIWHRIELEWDRSSQMIDGPKSEHDTTEDSNSSTSRPISDPAPDLSAAEGQQIAHVAYETVDAEARLRTRIRVRKKLGVEKLQPLRDSEEITDVRTESRSHETSMSHTGEDGREDTLKMILEKRGRKHLLDS